MSDDLEVMSGLDRPKGLEAQLIGTTVADKYEIVSLLGEGGVGLVFKARHVLMHRNVAIKVIRPEFVGNEMTVQRFTQEARAISALQHPNIVTVHDFGITPSGMPYLVMDLLEGISLSDVIRAEGRLHYLRALRIFRQTCMALEHAHANGIVHRDLKASNIMICRDNEQTEQAKLVDFGMAKLVRPDTDGTGAQELTQAGDVFGSPLYMSPEQCKGMRLDRRSDIYSLGCSMYYALSGDPPFVGDNMLHTLQKHINETPTNISILVGEVDFPAGLDDIVLKCLRKNPDERYQSAVQIIEDIDQIIAGRVVSHNTMQIKYKHRPKTAATSKVHFVISLALLIICVGMAAFVYGRMFDEYREDQWANLWVDFTQEGARALRNGDYAEAQKAYLNAVTEAQQFGRKDPRLASSMISLGTAFIEDKQYARGEVWIKRGLDVLETCFGPDCPEMYPALTALSRAHKAQGKTTEAEETERRAMVVLEPNEHNRYKLMNFLTQYAQRKRTEGDAAGARTLEERAHKLTHAMKNKKKTTR